MVGDPNRIKICVTSFMDESNVKESKDDGQTELIVSREKVIVREVRSIWAQFYLSIVNYLLLK